MTRRTVLVSAVGVIALVAIAMVAVAAVSPFERERRPLPCLPAAPTAQPLAVVRGGFVQITSSGFPCAYTAASDATAQVGLAAPDRQLAVDLGEVRVHRDGSYSRRFRIPMAATIGPAYVAVNGGIYDRCRDVEQSGCPGVTVDISIAR